MHRRRRRFFSRSLARSRRADASIHRPARKKKSAHAKTILFLTKTVRWDIIIKPPDPCAF
jgi:hypothetical protein